MQGRYRDDDPPAPYVRAQVYLPGLRAAAEVDFLVDTGADATSLMPDDMATMGIDVRNFKGRYRKVEGIGCEARYKTTKAVNSGSGTMRHSATSRSSRLTST